MTTPLPTFFDQLGRAWRLFLNRWSVAVVLQLLMVIPALLMIPLMLEYMGAVDSGADVTAVLADSVYTTQFLIGLVGSVLFGVLAMTAMVITFASKKKISLMVALTSAVKKYIPVLYTSFIAGLAVALAFVPSEVLKFWYLAVRSGLPVSGSGLTALDSIVSIALVAFIIPAVIVSVWVMYAPLAVAIGEVSGGITALLFTKAIVHTHIWAVIWRMVGAMVLFQVITISVSTLPLAQALVPFTLTILIVAFFVELYKELRVR